MCGCECGCVYRLLNLTTLGFFWSILNSVVEEKKIAGILSYARMHMVPLPLYAFARGRLPEKMEHYDVADETRITKVKNVK